MHWDDRQVLPKSQSVSVRICWDNGLTRAGLDLSAFVLLVLSDRTVMRFGIYMLERRLALSGMRSQVRLKTSIPGTVPKRVERKAEGVIVLRVTTNRRICITSPKTLGHIPVVRSRNLVTKQPM